MSATNNQSLDQLPIVSAVGRRIFEVARVTHGRREVDPTTGIYAILGRSQMQGKDYVVYNPTIGINPDTMRLRAEDNSMTGSIPFAEIYKYEVIFSNEEIERSDGSTRFERIN